MDDAKFGEQMPPQFGEAFLLYQIPPIRFGDVHELSTSE